MLITQGAHPDYFHSGVVSGLACAVGVSELRDHPLAKTKKNGAHSFDWPCLGNNSTRGDIVHADTTRLLLIVRLLASQTQV